VAGLALYADRGLGQPIMSDINALKDKLRKIEALFAGAATPGEKASAGAAAERIRAKLNTLGGSEPPIEIKYSLPDPWSRRLFIALCRRYGLKPFRYPRMRRQTIIVRGPRSFLESVLWPEFVQLDEALVHFLTEITDKVIREEVFGDGSDAEEVQEPPKLG
jgi:hypothetical protein